MLNDLENWWMPFTDNKAFKTNPRLLKQAKGIYYTKQNGEQIIDGTSGLWCCNMGHGQQKIIDAVHAQLQQMDYAPSFHLGHAWGFELASRLTTLAPKNLNHVFFTNSGSESVDTALKIALNYWYAKGEGQRRMFIGRDRGYHGVGFGGISVGGMSPNRRTFGALLPSDHLPHTHLSKNAFSKGQPEHGAYLADTLEDLIALHDANNIAAVIVEPMAGSTGVLIAPKGYLEKIRTICDNHNILLIFDEVITGFGRLGASFASIKYGISPDIMTTAKALTNGVIPMGAVFVSDSIYYDTTHNTENGIELYHGYTYSGHPIASAAALATLDIMADEGVVENARTLTPYFEDMMHSLRDCPNVIDIRNEGIVGAIEFMPTGTSSKNRAFSVFDKAFHKHGLLCRASGETIALSPPLILNKSHIDEIGDKMRQALCDAPL